MQNWLCAAGLKLIPRFRPSIQSPVSPKQRSTLAVSSAESPTLVQAAQRSARTTATTLMTDTNPAYPFDADGTENANVSGPSAPIETTKLIASANVRSVGVTRSIGTVSRSPVMGCGAVGI